MQFTPIISTDLAEQKAKKSTTRSHVAKAQRKRLVELWHKSSTTQVKFCQAHNIHPKTFSRWLKDYETLNTTSGAAKPAKAMNKIKPNTATQAIDANFTIELPNAVKLHVTSPNAQQCLLIKELCTCKYN